MKKNFPLTIAILLIGFLFTSLSAQVDEREALMSLGDQNALTIDIQNVDQKELESYFKSYFKEYGKVKYNRKGNEYYMNEAKIKSISKDKVNVYAKMEELNKAARLYLWVDSGMSIINSDENEKEFEAASDILVDFSTFIEKSLIEDELKAAEKNLEKMERDLTQLEKDNKKYHSSIEDAQKKIAEMEEAIDQNVKDQENKNQELSIHKEGVEEIRSKLNNVGKSKKIKM